MMKKLLVCVLGLGVTYQVAAQNKPIKQNYQDGQVNLTVQQKGPKRTMSKSASAFTVDPIQLTGAVNAFTQVGTARVRLAACNAINTIAFIHRGGQTGATSGNNNYFDVSTDGGSTWTTDIQMMPTYSATLGHRYPQGAIMNPAGNTDPANARLVGMAPAALGTNNGWGGLTQGSMTLSGANVKLSKFQDGNAFIPQSMIAGAPGTVWASDDTTTDGKVSIYKGTYNAALDSVEWTMNFQIDAEAIMDKMVDSATHYYTAWIGFDPTGMQGWIGMAGDLAADGTDSLTYPIFWKTTDGGNNWTGPMAVKLSSLPVIANDSIMFGLPPTTSFDDGMAVDANGNPHFFLAASPFSSPYSVANTTQGLYDVTTTDNGTTWTAMLVDTIFGLRGSSFGTLTHDNELKASVSPDGTKIFFSWTATPIANQDPNDAQPNDFPDLFVRGYNVTTGGWTPVYNITAGSNFDGAAFLPTVALHTTYSGGVNSFHSVIVEPTGDENVAINFYYLDDVDINDNEFVTGISKTKNNDLFAISQNYPNPVAKNGNTSFNITLNKASDVKVRVTNMLGQIMSEESQFMLSSSAPQAVEMNTANLSAGVYFYTVTAGGFEVTNKMIVR